MTTWETENELSSAAAATLPTPSDTPYKTPSRRSSRASRKSRRSVTPPADSSLPPPLPDGLDKQSKRSSRDISTDDKISILDPRRFTPTLHASLVSEILTLRRDQEEKLKFIDGLETTLHSTRQEQESIQSTLLTTAKENRSLKRQLALLEGGTSSALRELARERDEAVDAISETKKRLEVAQKKTRTQEEDSQRVHDQWAKERDEWEEERRKYERRLHVADTRLKAVLDEVANYQAAETNGQQAASEGQAEDGGKENDGASIRTMSITNSVRYSVAPKANGHSLADELNLDDDDEYETEPDGRQSVLSNAYHRRAESRDSIMSKTGPRAHRRNTSIESQMRPASAARGRMYMNQAVLDRLEGDIREDDENPPAPKPEYKDTGIQFSPPPSPKLAPVKPSTPEPHVKVERFDIESPPRVELEIEANQRRKRVYINKPAPIDAPSISKLMVSAGSQTSERPVTPPQTPAPLFSIVTLSTVEIQPVEVEASLHQMTSLGTQTEKPELVVEGKSAAPHSFPIPTISVIPPTSRPSSPGVNRLPQHSKDFGCQVSIIRAVQMTSVAVQTDEIRVDQRLDRLPPHLHPSAISSRPVSPNPAAAGSLNEDKNSTPLPGGLPPRNPRRLAAKHSFVQDGPPSPVVPSKIAEVETRDAYPGNNDNGPLSNQKAPMRRPHRISSLFAGFEAASSDEGDEFGGDGSDSEFHTPLSAPKPPSAQGHRQKQSNGTVSTIDHVSVIKDSRNSVNQVSSTDIYNNYSKAAKRESVPNKPSLPKVASSSRNGTIRKSAIIQSGIASHQIRSRSPSLPDARDPPFPIPTRASSRKPPFTISLPSDGQRSPTSTADSWQYRGMRSGAYRTSSIRKSRSATGLPRNQRYRRNSRSPPPMSPSEEAPESPGLPPLPNNDITTPRTRDYGMPRYRSHRPQPSTTTANTVNTDNTNMHSVGSSSQQQASSVVDAIAQTMVGEWMYKYVRRRKSFGVSDGRGDEGSNDRHKRWVWLAPYERAILWSSKQPSSGSALMGKSGRKLTIQSVLDVKDDTPPPKGVTQVFNRSILILTPQRALKFTATSAERHYLWLTALAFLAHSQQAVPEMILPAGAASAAAPPPPGLSAKMAPGFDMPPAKSKRPGIRDSIMLKKGKGTTAPRVDVDINTTLLEEPITLKTESFPSVPNHQRDYSRDVAEPPLIPRYHHSTDRVHERANQIALHGRKRSNTGGHIPPPLSFRGFSSPTGQSYHVASNSTAGNSVITSGSSEIYTAASSAGNTTWAMSTVGSQRTSEASSRPGNNFFEAIGTVRMEAFISPLAFPRFEENPDEQEELRYRARRRSKEIRRRRSRSRQRDSYTSRTTRGTDDWYGGSRTAGEEEYFREDPFRGF
ncbi:hypothetical protein BX600DRAFT_233074 [Xylariales sp. PMI_506]|nr:hypothetical protein BX600DRAFT_233074 [Xylariales sp. PMI_506]